MSWQTRSSPAPPPGAAMTSNPHHQPPSIHNVQHQQPPQQQQQPQSQHYQAAAPNPNHSNHIQQSHQTQQWSQYPKQSQQISNVNPTQQGIPQQQPTSGNWFAPNQSAAPNQLNQHPTQGFYDNRPPPHGPNVNVPAKVPQHQHQTVQHPYNASYSQPNNTSIPFQQTQQQPPLGNAVMAGEPEQFRAAALFDNAPAAGNTDGWEDEWGWTDNSNNNSLNTSNNGPPTGISNTALNYQTQQTMPQPSQQPPYPQKPNQPQPPIPQQLNPIAQQTQLPPPQQQFPQHSQPPPPQQPFSQPAQRPQPPNQPFQQPPTPNQTQDFFNNATSRESSSPFLDNAAVSQNSQQRLYQPPPAQSPYLAYNNPQPTQNVAHFADSFNANNTNWNWNQSSSNATILNPLADTPSTLLETAPAQFATVGQAASEKYNSRNVSESGIPASTYDTHSQPDDSTNTQITSTRSAASASGNQLTPQWSIESQVSQTSSDLSLDTRSSLTNTSEEHPYQQKFPPKPYPYNGTENVQQQPQPPIEEVDLLEQTLQSLNVDSQANNSEVPHNSTDSSAQPYWQPQQQSYQFNLNPAEQVSLPNITEANEQTAYAPQSVFSSPDTSVPQSTYEPSSYPNNPIEVPHSTPPSSFAHQQPYTSTVATPAIPTPSLIPPSFGPPRTQSPLVSVPPPANAVSFMPSPFLQPDLVPPALVPQTLQSAPAPVNSSSLLPPASGPPITQSPLQSQANNLSFTHSPFTLPRNDSTESFAYQQPLALAAPQHELAPNTLPPPSVMPPPSLPPKSQSPLVSAPSQPPQPSQSPFDPSSYVAQTNNPSNVAMLPPTQHQPPPPTGAPGGNPFKRTGAPIHKTLQFQNTSAPLSAPMLVNQVSQPPVAQPLPPTTNVEDPVQPENSEILSDAPHNDRNQYLQTGHLSEEPTFSAPESNQQIHPTDTNDYLPPPGLSRFVLGQPEVSLPNTSQLEPPPGLDRMVPGIELSNSTQLNLERQADGQDTISPSVPLRNTNVGSFNNAPTTPVTQPSHHEPLQNTDRNLYLVLGDESDAGQVASGQRVVDGRNTSDEPQAGTQPLVASSEQRELVMDGENLEDDAIRSRDEPLEGANLLDGPTQAAAVPEPAHHHDVAQLAAPKKFNDGSLAGSTGNDESDRERTNYFNRAAPRRSDEPTRRREKPAADQRYDTEDTDYYSDRERERKRFGREGSARRTMENKDRYDRDREAGGRHRGDSGRSGPQSARSDKYHDEQRGNVSRREGGDRFEKDRYRYETDGSRYDPDDSRYNRQTRRRGEDDLDRKYRRGERGSDGRRRDNRYHEDRDRDIEPRRVKNPSSRGGDRYYDPDEYGSQRSSSRNATERPDKLSKRYAPEMASYYPQHQQAAGQAYGMDQYHQYYQQVQYYENLRRTNPQAYAELYHRMYGQQGQADALGQQQNSMVGMESTGLTDGRESVHSGRSSTNERYSTRQSTTNIKQMQHRYYDSTTTYQQQSFSQQLSSTMLDPVVITNGQPRTSARSHSPYISHISYTQDSRSAGRIDSGTAAESMTVDEEPARLTPCKFTTDHCTASLANGLMVCVKPQFSSNSDFTSVVRIMQINVNDSTRKLFQLYPGPLARGVTHKKTVIEFCEEQIRLGPQPVGQNAAFKSRGNSMSSLFSQQSQPVLRSSYTLMWNLLILLLRQNGVVVGTDISELLMQNKKEFPYDVLSDSKGSSSIGHPESVAEEDPNSPTADGSEEPITPDELTASPSSSVSHTISEEEITERFRNYLLYGSINEALDWATDNNLWGHALFLASKVDRRAHANVLMKFANKLSLNDPLQTLYQLMSGRTPNSVTSIQDEKWGDWRPHLAMILANTSPKPELDRKSITTLGDSLYNRGDLFAAQFCYLMAQVGFGRYCNVNQDSVLMSNASNAIRLILLGSSHHRVFREFATNDAIMMTEIYEYACTLNDDHFSIVEFQAYKYLLATRMLDAGLNLKSLMYLEQVAQHIGKNRDRFDDSFVQKVFTLAEQLKYFDPVYERMMYEADNSAEDGAVSNSTNTAVIEDQPWLKELASTLKQYTATSNLGYPNESTVYSEPTPSESLSAINQQFLEINQQFSNLNMQYSAPTETAVPSPMQQYQQYQSLPTYADQPVYDPYTQGQSSGYDSQQQPASLPSNTDTYGYDQAQTTFQPAPAEQTEQPNYDYWNQQHQQQPDAYQSNQNEEMAKPSISMPNSISSKPNFYADDDEAPQGGANKSTGSASTGKSDSTSKSVLPAKSPGQSSATNSGWFGGIWNKLSLKPKNQMILPDDKNPAIVWDSDKKKWVNTDGEAEEAEQFRPPPKMAEMAPRLAPGNVSFAAPNAEPPSFNPGPPQTSYDQPQSAFGSAAPSALPPSVPTPGPVGSSLPSSAPAVDPSPTSVMGKTPNLQSNMFKKQRNQTLKKSYVDVFNPSGAPAKPIETAMMAPLLPAGPPGGFFIPGAPVATGQSQEGGNQFYNPNQFAGANGPSSYQ